MAKWAFWIGIVFTCWSCQSDSPKHPTAVTSSAPSGTVVFPDQEKAAVPLVFFLKELVIKNCTQCLIRDTAIFRSLPAGVYEIEADTILFGPSSSEWIGSGVTRWPPTGRIALADFIDLDQGISYDQIGIFPQQPEKNGYLPGCFSCPAWMAGKFGELLAFWEEYLVREGVSGRGRPN